MRQTDIKEAEKHTEIGRAHTKIKQEDESEDKGEKAA